MTSALRWAAMRAILIFKVEVNVLRSRPYNKPTVSVDVKQHSTNQPTYVTFVFEWACSLTCLSFNASFAERSCTTQRHEAPQYSRA